MDELYRTIALHSRSFRGQPIDAVVDALVNRGNTFVAVHRGSVRVLSKTQRPALSSEFIDTLEKYGFGLDTHLEVAYAAHYTASAVSLSTATLLKPDASAPSAAPAAAATDDVAGALEAASQDPYTIERAIEAKVGVEKFQAQLATWHTFSAEQLASSYSKMIGKKISPKTIEAIAAGGMQGVEAHPGLATGMPVTHPITLRPSTK